MLENISNNSMYITEVHIEPTETYDYEIYEYIDDYTDEYIDTRFVEEEERAFRELLKHEPQQDGD